MSKYYPVYILSMLICLLSAKAEAQSTPKYSNEFLSIGVGAKALGMSNTASAMTNDVTAGYWNPAGLSRMEKNFQGSLMHTSYFAGIANYDYAAIAAKVDSVSALGFSFIRFSIDDIPDTRFLVDDDGRINYDQIQSFSTSDMAFLFSYSRKIQKVNGLHLGGNIKLVHRDVGIFASAWGFGLDLGAQYVKKSWQFGLSVHDASTTYNVWNINSEVLYDAFIKTGNEIPSNSVEITLPKALFDVAKSFTIKNKLGILVAAGFDVTFDGFRNTPIKGGRVSYAPKAGLQFDYKKVVFLRGGVGNFQEIKNFDSSKYMTYQPNFGVGLKLKGFEVDYALTDLGDQSEALYTHVFSLKFGFNKIDMEKIRQSTQ